MSSRYVTSTSSTRYPAYSIYIIIIILATTTTTTTTIIMIIIIIIIMIMIIKIIHVCRTRTGTCPASSAWVRSRCSNAYRKSLRSVTFTVLSAFSSPPTSTLHSVVPKSQRSGLSDQQYLTRTVRRQP
ncbi:hypothetical protein T492DRAFT_84047 [Pavlovales sp. CCMP2436]|nr:hypothetical protein T492DRAFT_84047 [Pavlovales sp. CCMP2436]